MPSFVLYPALFPLPLSDNSSPLGTVARSTVVHEYCAIMNVLVNNQLFIEQFYIFFTIHGGTRGHREQSGGARIAHCTPSHLARWVFLCGHCIFSQKKFTCRVRTTNCRISDSFKCKTFPIAQLSNLRNSWQNKNN